MELLPILHNIGAKISCYLILKCSLIDFSRINHIKAADKIHIFHEIIMFIENDPDCNLQVKSWIEILNFLLR